MAHNPLLSSSPSSATTAFLRSIADIPPVEDAARYCYAASVILPETGWPPEEFMERLLRDLAQTYNQRPIEQAVKDAKAGSYTPFSFNLTAQGGNSVQFQA